MFYVRVWQTIDVPEYLLYPGFETCVDDDGNNILMYAIKYTLDDIGDSIFITNKSVRQLNRNGNNAAILYVRFRKTPIPESLKYPDFQKQINTNGENLLQAYLLNKIEVSSTQIISELFYQNMETHLTGDGDSAYHLWVKYRKDDVPDSLKYRNFEKQLDKNGFNIFMNWIKHRKSIPPAELMYPFYYLQKANAGETVDSLWAENLGIISMNFNIINLSKEKDKDDKYL